MPYNTWNSPVTPYSYGNQYAMPNYAQYQPSYAQQIQQAQAQQQQVQQAAQIQNGGFVSVPNIDVARNWAVAPGNSVTFKDESAPYIYTKTMGYNQLDTPKFERFRLVKEEEIPQASAPKADSGAQQPDLSVYALKSDLDAVKGTLDTVKGELSEFRSRLDRNASAQPAREAEKQEGT